ncbi:DUF4007 family protein [Alkalimonas sp. MEB004]|uniref:DUF4007 family protein n=2 Tax=Alkalimonas mucilaginosa TaxID=3057676 RepID=A0ABU7JI34_9GAMM|nr:DUF4007 family protein [Alkalimonas sp. MEB004]
MADVNCLIKKAKFNSAEFIAELGVGKNMLASMKHWAQACQIIEEHDASSFALTELAKKIFLHTGHDPYSEQATSTWLLHWNMARKSDRATTCYWLFNRINSGVFSKSELLQQLSSLCAEANKVVSRSSLTRDIDTIVRSYTPKSELTAIEDNADPVFGELGLINHLTTDHYSFNRGPKSSLNLPLFLYIVLDYWRASYTSDSTLSLDAIAYGEASPGRILKLDEDSIIAYLIEADDLTSGRIRWSDLAGIKQLSKQNFDVESVMIEMLRKAYE